MFAHMLHVGSMPTLGRPESDAVDGRRGVEYHVREKIGTILEKVSIRLRLSYFEKIVDCGVSA